MNTTKTNKIAETAARLTAHAANLTVMQALTDAWNALTDEQRDDFTKNVGDLDYVTVAIGMGGTSARLVDDEWHREIGGGNPAAIEYVRGLETLLAGMDGGAFLVGEMWDGAEPEQEESYRPIYYTSSQLNRARDTYQNTLANMTALLTTN